MKRNLDIKNTGFVLLAFLGLAGCFDDQKSEPERKLEISTPAEIPTTKTATPEYNFRIFGTETDSGPGKHWLGACDLQDEPENLLLFSIHSPGHRNGGGKGGSNPPGIKFSRSMNMQWVAGIEGTGFQAYKFELKTHFERKRKLIPDQTAGLDEVARVSFGGSETPVFHVEEVTSPGILHGYHAWFRVMQTDHPYYGEERGLTGNLYAHLHLKKTGRTQPDNDPWTRDKIIAIYESFYTQKCFKDYFEKYSPIKNNITVSIVN